MTTNGPAALRLLGDNLAINDSCPEYALQDMRILAAQWQTDRAALERARALLKKIGIFRYDGMDCCVMCDTPIIDGHAPGCELAAALSGGAR